MARTVHAMIHQQSKPIFNNLMVDAGRPRFSLSSKRKPGIQLRFGGNFQASEKQTRDSSPQSSAVLSK
jgi:hypothetical protein